MGGGDKVIDVCFDYQIILRPKKNEKPMTALQNDLGEWLMSGQTAQAPESEMYMFDSSNQQQQQRQKLSSNVQSGNEYSISSEEREIVKKAMMEETIAAMLEAEDVDPFSADDDNLLEELDGLLDENEENNKSPGDYSNSNKRDLSEAWNKLNTPSTPQ